MYRDIATQWHWTPDPSWAPPHPHADTEYYVTLQSLSNGICH